MSPINFNNTKIFTFGTDINSEDEIIMELKESLDKNPKITNCFVISDFGNPLFSSRLIEKEVRDTIYSKASLIESGFLTFKLINGGAPIESIMLSLDRKIEKP